MRQLALLSVLAIAPSVPAADWPTYGHDSARSHTTAEVLPFPLQQSWVYRPRHAPQPAWGDPKSDPVEAIRELRRIHFDDVYQPVVAEGSLYFGSSADCHVYCLDTSTGRLRWRFLTGGPVRLAPSVSGQRVYFGSDDGYAYCLKASDGELVWKFRAAPEDRRVIGNGRLISLWPARTGVLVDGGTAYLGAGVFPAEGIFVYALDAATGTQRWRNDTGGEAPQSRVSPQGYLLASAASLYAPMGRVSPAAFDRATGKLQEMTYFGKEVGGTYALLSDARIYTGTEEIVSYAERGGQGPKGDRFAILGGRKLIVAGNMAYVAGDQRLYALDRAAYPALSRKLKALLQNNQTLAEVAYQPRKELNQAKRDITDLTEELGEARTKAPASVAKLEAGLAARTKAAESAQKALNDVQAKAAALKPQIAEARENLKRAYLWDIPCDVEQELVLAGQTLIGGGAGSVTAIDSGSGKIVWSAEVDGAAKGLAVAGDQLYASTDRGSIYCFGPARPSGTAVEVVEPVRVQRRDIDAGRLAARIIEQTGVSRGYCLVYGCETGELATALAERSNLLVYAVSPDADKVAAARKTAETAGLLCSRVSVEQWPWEQVPYPDYFANLIVSETLLAGGLPGSAVEMGRMLKPCGGVAWLGTSLGGGNRADEGSDFLARFGQWRKPLLTEATLGAASPEKLIRGPLRGAGSWTHLYGNPGNTACGDDARVKAPLSVLWFGEPGPHNMNNRHVRSVGPVSGEGRVFCPGENVLMAFDAYNGLKLWEKPMPGAGRIGASLDSGNVVLTREALFVAADQVCHRLDPATGATLATHHLPASPGETANRKWGYLACDGKLLYGTRSAKAGTGEALFAMDPATGQLQWLKQGLHVQHNSIALGDGRLFLVDNDLSLEQQRKLAPELAAEAGETRAASKPVLAGGTSAAATAPRRRSASARTTASSASAGKRPRSDGGAETGTDAGVAAPDAAPTGSDSQQMAAGGVRTKTDVRTVIALEAASGRVLWRKPLDVSFGKGGSLAVMYSNGALVLFNVYTDGHFWQQFFAGEFSGRRVTVLAGDDGHVLWSKPLGYRVRPLIVGDTLHAEPWAFDLISGKPKSRVHPITGRDDDWQFARPGHHCGCPSATAACLFFRSFCLGYYDLLGDFGTQHFGGQRPGCWINFIPANGLLLMPEGSAGCMCAFPNMCTVAFEPVARGKGYSYYSAEGATTPVRRLALNLGAPGDRVDSRGNLWLGFPRPGGSLVLPLKATVAFAPGGGYVARSSDYTPIAGTADPWLFTSAARGLAKCVIPLLGKSEGTALYSVRLAFADPDNDRPARRVFDIKLQGRTVAQRFDAVAEAGGRDRAVIKTFENVEVTDNLVIELAGTSRRPSPEESPILQGVEVVRQRVTSLGCALADLEFNTATHQQQTTIELANIRDEGFSGALELTPPAGFTVTPRRVSVELASGAHRSIELKVTMARTAAVGKHPLSVRLIGSDGHVELQRQTTLENLGRRGRIILPAAEDAGVIGRYPEMNKGAATTAIVDGGDREVGDIDHGLLYIKFRLDLPGKPLAARLRLHNAGNPTNDSGRVRLVDGPWEETTITYDHRPQPAADIGRLGRVSEHETVECPLKVDLAGRRELSLVIDPTSTDGVDYLTRESGQPPELLVEYELP